MLSHHRFWMLTASWWCYLVRLWKL
jgi:hypothetical protein